MTKGNYIFPALIVFTLFSLTGCNAETIKQPEKNPEKIANTSNHEFLDKCTTDMATQFHIHPHLTIINQGKPVVIPANVGITNDCMSSIHTHDASGIIHVEAPEKRDFILSDFFYNWKLPYGKDRIMDMKTDFNHQFKIYVDGSEVTDLDKILLTDHQDIVIDYYDVQKGPAPKPPAYVWADN